jgi:RHS repeat-associated protein
LEETHYYAFGLTMAGISSKALKPNYSENKSKFNGGNELQSKEFSDGSGLELYDATFRMYDPQIGRFHQIVLLADLFEDYSPYVFALNNPILMNDPIGLAADTAVPGVPLMPEVVVTPNNPTLNPTQVNCPSCEDLTEEPVTPQPRAAELAGFILSREDFITGERRFPNFAEFAILEMVLIKDSPLEQLLGTVVVGKEWHQYLYNPSGSLGKNVLGQDVFPRYRTIEASPVASFGRFGRGQQPILGTLLKGREIDPKVFHRYKSCEI